MTREKEIFKVTIVGGIVNTILLAFKFIAGVVGHSSAMIADAVHSLSDFATDIIVLIFVKISGKPQDDSHDYGHGKFETLATTIIGAALLGVAVGIIVKGINNVVLWAKGGELEAPGMIAFWAAIVSIVLKEGTFQYTAKKAKDLNSQAVMANAWHHRSDALSSIGTAVGIGGAAILGNRWTVLDPVASIIVGAFIIKVAAELLKNGIDDLTEVSLPAEVEKEITDIICSFPDVTEPHHLRTRRIGNDYAIEVHIRMNGDITLRQAHDRATDIENALKDRFGEKTHIGIHLEPTKPENQ